VLLANNSSPGLVHQSAGLRCIGQESLVSLIDLLRSGAAGISGEKLTSLLDQQFVRGGLRLAGACLLCLLVMTSSILTVARAQSPGVPGTQVFYSNIGPLGASVPSGGDPRPQSAQGAVQFLDWLVWAGLSGGLACDYNLNQSPTNQIQACGPQFGPSLVAARNTGIQRSILYVAGDVRYYPTVNQVDLHDTKAGAVHVWEIQRDLIFRVQGQGTWGRQYSGFAANLLSTDRFVTSPVPYTQGYGSTSIQKNFGRFFSAIGGSVTATAYENIEDNLGNTILQDFRNGTVSTANGRVGYHVSPITYTYIEPTVNWQRYADARLNSEGYRVVAGIGTERFSLFNGEIFGGYAQQRFEDPTIGDASIPVIGGKLSWFPTRFLTFTFTADRTFGTSDFSLIGVPGAVNNVGPGLLPGSTTTATTVSLNGKWDINRWFSFSGTVADQRLDYLNSDRQDDLVTATAVLTYKITERFNAHLTYIRADLLTNFPGAEFSRDAVLVGGGTSF
jgi:hypothetical protein